jgi:hypothetical protein
MQLCQFESIWQFTSQHIFPNGQACLVIFPPQGLESSVHRVKYRIKSLRFPAVITAVLSLNELLSPSNLLSLETTFVDVEPIAEVEFFTLQLCTPAFTVPQTGQALNLIANGYLQDNRGFNCF